MLGMMQACWGLLKLFFKEKPLVKEMLWGEFGFFYQCTTWDQ